MTRHKLTALVLGLALVAACDKGGPQDILGTLPTARVKFFNFGVNAPGVNFYANNTKLTAISSTSCVGNTTSVCRTTGIESTTGVAFGAAAAGGLYAGLDAGQYTLTGRIAAAADNGLPVASVQASLENGKSYSYFVSGVYDAATKKVDAFMIEDPIPTTEDYTVTTIRFVNAISNSQPLQLFLRNQASGVESPVGSAVAYKNATAFVTFTSQSVFNPGGVVDLVVRTPGSSTNFITRTTLTFGLGRVYTIAARGDATVTSTTATTRPLLDVTSNR